MRPCARPTRTASACKLSSRLRFLELRELANPFSFAGPTRTLFACKVSSRLPLSTRFGSLRIPFFRRFSNDLQEPASQIVLGVAAFLDAMRVVVVAAAAAAVVVVVVSSCCCHTGVPSTRATSVLMTLMPTLLLSRWLAAAQPLLTQIVVNGKLSESPRTAG